MTIYWHPTGPYVAYNRGFLHVEDLNPEVKTKWRMSRLDLIKTGLRFVFAALR